MMRDVVSDLPRCNSVTADIEGRTDEYIVAAKRGYAIYSKKEHTLRYNRKIYEDDPVKAERMRFVSVTERYLKALEITS